MSLENLFTTETIARAVNVVKTAFYCSKVKILTVTSLFWHNIL